MKIRIAIVALALSLCSTAAFAVEQQDMKDMKGMNHEGMNHDGMKSMTPEQMAKKHNDMFMALDADKNGSISRAEFDRYHADMMAKHMKSGQADMPKEGHDHVDTHK